MDQIRSTAKERFANRIGAVTSSELEALEESLREVLGLP
jgi:mRNA-degrading endonuclease toxin of MazEF toxin-antitoxin module